MAVNCTARDAYRAVLDAPRTQPSSKNTEDRDAFFAQHIARRETEPLLALNSPLDDLDGEGVLDSSDSGEETVEDLPTRLHRRRASATRPASGEQSRLIHLPEHIATRLRKVRR